MKLLEKIKQLWRSLLIALNLEYDPSNGLKLPARKQPKGEPKKKLADDVWVGVDGLWRTSETEENRFESKRVADEKQASVTSELAPEEVTAIENSSKKLDLHKAILIKKMFSEPKATIKTASMKLNKMHGSGYSERIVSDYWTIFNAASKK